MGGGPDRYRAWLPRRSPAVPAETLDVADRYRTG